MIEIKRRLALLSEESEVYLVQVIFLQQDKISAQDHDSLKPDVCNTLI